MSSAIWFCGCGSSSPTTDPVSGDGQMSEIEKELAKLSDSDRKLAEAQKTCPVGGGLLGGMGVPIKLDVKSQPVFICCESCRDTIMDDPDTYLAKLKKE